MESAAVAVWPVGNGEQFRKKGRQAADEGRGTREIVGTMLKNGRETFQYFRSVTVEKMNCRFRVSFFHY